MSFDLTHCRHDPAHCLAPGLFRSLGRGDRKRLKLDITYSFGEDRIEFSGPESLGTDDLRVLQGLVAMAAISGEGGRGIMLRPDTDSDIGRQLRLFLDLQWESLEQDTMVAKGSYRHLAKEIGYAVDSGGAYKTIRDCIERLWKVSIIVQRGGKRHGFRVLSEYASDEETGKLFVALNPRIAEAITGERAFTWIEMAEVRQIKGANTVLIHQRLCGRVGPGESGKVGIDTLCDYAWPDPASDSTTRKRRQRIREALDELASIGWEVSEYAKGKFNIKRPEVVR